ncbi:MAG: recombination protein RecR [Bacilli bacterium]|nr:recombination protein RecR [Bacillota bacterium]MBR6821175.1 recombination protein RecR [Bacilli bacterium]
MAYPTALSDLINYFRKLPGIGEKSAERMALSLLELTGEDVENFAASMVDSKNNLHPCEVCGHITDKDVCDICSNEHRNKSVICILEDYKSVFAFEKAGNYNGTYHVLNGLISPIDDINPEDINISSLIDRVDKLENPELIIALKSTIEGETTTLYLKKIFENKNVEISRLSYGIPMGAEIDYLDEITLDRALSDRKKIS